MARPERKDVDYFPFYVKNGRTLQILEGKYECKGTGFFTNVLRFLSVRPDHHFSMAEESDRLWFFSETKCDEESGIDMLNIMALTGKINKELWSHEIIASQDYLDSVSDAYRKRSNEIITIYEIFMYYNIVSSGRNPQNSGRNPHASEFPAPETTPNDEVDVVSGGGYPQSKGKESKEKKKEKKFSQKEFDSFMAIYPNKKEIRGALKKWKALCKSKELPHIEIILKSVQNQILWRKNANGEFRPDWKNPKTWLNNGCWDDETPMPAIPDQQESLKITCSAGPCSKEIEEPGYCMECQTILDESNCKTYEEYCSQGHIKKGDFKKLTDGLFEKVT